MAHALSATFGPREEHPSNHMDRLKTLRPVEDTSPSADDYLEIAAFVSGSGVGARRHRQPKSGNAIRT